MDWFLYDNDFRHEKVKWTFWWQSSFDFSLSLNPILNVLEVDLTNIIWYNQNSGPFARLFKSRLCQLRPHVNVSPIDKTTIWIKSANKSEIRKDIWNIWEVLNLINLEIGAREKFIVHEKNSESDGIFSGSALISTSNQRNIKKCTNA